MNQQWRCATCLYERDTECHRVPPIVVVVNGKRLTAWPAVRPEDGCGDWAFDHEKAKT